MKLLLALQFFNGDREKAIELANFIAALEPRHSDIADFVFVARYDTPQSDLAVQTIARKFDVSTFTTRRKAVGWPYGCNEMWFDFMTHLCEQKNAGRLGQYKAVLTFESDCCPLRKGWIESLSDEWDKQNKKVVGHLTNCGPNTDHINGNAMFSMDIEFLRFLRATAGCKANAGWDLAMAREFKKWGWADSKKIISWWRHENLPEQEYEEMLYNGTVLFHGIKDGSLASLVKSKFLPPIRVNVIR